MLIEQRYLVFHVEVENRIVAMNVIMLNFAHGQLTNLIILWSTVTSVHPYRVISLYRRSVQNSWKRQDCGRFLVR
jgi:hypothetical protein